MKKYYYEAQQIDEQILQVAANCSGLMFINQNAFIVYINNFPLQAGATLVLDPQNANDIDVSTYRIGWGNNVGNLNIFKRIYLK
jgi:hypothetical protein